MQNYQQNRFSLSQNIGAVNFLQLVMDFGTAGAAWIEITYMPTELGNLWVILKKSSSLRKHCIW